MLFKNWASYFFPEFNYGMSNEQKKQEMNCISVLNNHVLQHEISVLNELKIIFAKLCWKKGKKIQKNTTHYVYDDYLSFML